MLHVFDPRPSSADQDAFARFYARTPEFVNPQLLIPHIRRLDGMFRSRPRHIAQLSKCRAVLDNFSFRTLHQQRHPMSLAVENCLEDWMGLYAEQLYTQRKIVTLCCRYNSVVKVTLLPCPPLEREIHRLRICCDARDEYLLLVPRRIKMVSRSLVSPQTACACCCLCALSRMLQCSTARDIK
jgi:hypothetical protein